MACFTNSKISLSASSNGPSDIPPETTISQVVGDDGEKRHRCEICGYTSKRYADLRDHQRIHSDERPFQCNICLARFKQRQTLRNHRRNVHKVSGIDNIPCVPSTKKSKNNDDSGMDLLSKLTSFTSPQPATNPDSTTQFSSLLEQLQNSMSGSTPPPSKKSKTETSGPISDSDFANLIGGAISGFSEPKVLSEHKKSSFESKNTVMEESRAVTPPSDSKTLLSSLTAAIQANQQAQQQAQHSASENPPKEPSLGSSDTGNQGSSGNDSHDTSKEKIESTPEKKEEIPAVTPNLTSILGGF